MREEEGIWRFNVELMRRWVAAWKHEGIATSETLVPEAAEKSLTSQADDLLPFTLKH